MRNDLIVGVNGERIIIGWYPGYIQEHPGQTLKLDVQRGDQTLQLPYQPRGGTVGEVIKDSPASAAGLLAGDCITSVNGEPVAGCHRCFRLP